MILRYRKKRSVLAILFAVATIIAIANPAAETFQASLDRQQLLADLRRLAADDMEGREVGTAGGARARAYIVERFGDVGLRPVNGRFEWAVEVAKSRAAGTATSSAANVIGVVPGLRSPAQYIVISAHYDHLGVRGGEIFNGADDNASGTAALFAVAAHFTKAPVGLSLLFAAFDGEESGMLGSRAFVASPPVPREALLLNLNLDMIARDENNELWVAGLRLQPALRPILEKVAAGAAVKIRIGHDDPAIPRDDWTVQSDQWSFIQAGIPGLYFGVADQRHHHRASDDFESITPDFYVNAVQTFIHLVEALDRNHETVVALGRGDDTRRTP